MKIPPSLVLATLSLFPLAGTSLLFGQENAPPADSSTTTLAEPVNTPPAGEEPAVVEAAPRLIAVLSPTEGSQARGTVTFETLDDGRVRVTAEMSGLNPNAKHAMHVHEFGDLSAADGSRAGDHFNPEGKEHGLPDSAERHPGDLGNLAADEAGNATVEQVIDGLTLNEGPQAILGRAIVVHEGEDKGTPPSGDAGGRIAQGVIAIAGSMPDRETGPTDTASALTTDSDAEAESALTTLSPTEDGALAAETPAPKPSSSANTNTPAEELGEVAEEIGRGAQNAARTTVRTTEKAVRTTAKAVERGVDEAGNALKKVGKTIEKATD